MAAFTGTVTITAKVGPGVQVTAQTFSNIGVVSMLLGEEVLVLEPAVGSAYQKKEFDMNSLSTISASISGNTYTFTMS